MKKYLYLLVLLSYLISSFAQTNDQWVNCTSGHHINDLLETNNIRWVATTGGLMKEDLGNHQQTFYNRGNCQIPSNNVRSLALGDSGELWMSTDLGTARLDGSTWSVWYDKAGLLHSTPDGGIFLAESDSLHWWEDGQWTNSMAFPGMSYLYVSDIEIDESNGDIWLSYFTFGIFQIHHFDGQDWEQFDYTNSPLPFDSQFVDPLQIDQQGNLWAGTTSGLYRFDGTNWNAASDLIPDFPIGAIEALAMDESGSIWAGMIRYVSTDSLFFGMLEINSTILEETIDFPDSFQSLEHCTGIFPSGNDLLTGTSYAGLWKYNTGWNRLPLEPSPLRSNEITQIVPVGNITYLMTGVNQGLENNYLQTFENGSWTFLENLPFQLLDYQTRICDVGPNDSIWLHSVDSLYVFANNEWTVPELPDIHPDVEEVNSYIYHTPAGKRWILDKWTSHLFYETGQGWLDFDYPEHGAVSENYFDYFTHPQTDDFWLASSNGISHYNGTQWELINPMDYGFPNSHVKGLAFDENGLVWAIAYNGLIKIENNLVTVFQNFDEATGAIIIDENQHIWVGLQNNLARFDGQTWTYYNQSNSGMPNGLVRSLVFDAEGNLWIGSASGGLALFNEFGLSEEWSEAVHTGTSNSIVDLEDEFRLYPNPISKENFLTIEFQKQIPPLNNIEVKLYTLLGQLVFRERMTNGILQINRSEMRVATGILILKIENDTEQVVKKIMLE